MLFKPRVRQLSDASGMINTVITMEEDFLVKSFTDRVTVKEDSGELMTMLSL
jgi:hypothetical protein